MTHEELFKMSYFELVDYCKNVGLDTESAESWTEERLMVWAESHR